MGKTQNKNTKTVNNELQQKIELLQQKIDTIENNKKQSIQKTVDKVKSNSCYNVIENFVNKNNLTLKPLNNEYNKQYIQLNSRNVMFVLFKSNNVVSLYCNYQVNENFVFSTYNKKLCFRGNLSLNELNEQLQTIYENSVKNLNNKTVTTSNLVNELKQQIELLKQQLQQ